MSMYLLFLKSSTYLFTFKTVKIEAIFFYYIPTVIIKIENHDRIVHMGKRKGSSEYLFI